MNQLYKFIQSVYCGSRFRQTKIYRKEYQKRRVEDPNSLGELGACFEAKLQGHILGVVVSYRLQ